MEMLELANSQVYVARLVNAKNNEFGWFRAPYR
jgi:hypothetical protein